MLEKAEGLYDELQSAFESAFGGNWKITEQPSSGLRVQLRRYEVLWLWWLLYQAGGSLEEGPRLWTLLVSLRESA